MKTQYQSYQRLPCRFQTVWLTVQKLLFMLMLTACFSAPQLYSAEHKQPPIAEKLEQISQSFEALKRSDAVLPDPLDKLHKELIPYQNQIERCILDNEEAIETLKTDILSLGEIKDDVDPDILKKRKELKTGKDNFEKDLALCRLNELQLKNLLTEITQAKQTFLKNQLLSRERSILEVSLDVVRQDDKANEIQAIGELARKVRRWSALWPAIILFSFGILAGFAWRIIHSPAKSHSTAMSPTLYDLFSGLHKNAPWILSVILVWIYLSLNPLAPPAITKTLSFSALLITAFSALGGVINTLYQPTETLGPIKRINWIFILAAIVTFLFSQESFGTLPASNLFAFIWYAAVAITVIAFISLLWMILRKTESFKNYSILYFPPVLVSLAAVISSLAGYRNLAIFLLFGMILSAVVLVAAFFLLRISSEFFDSMDEAKMPWQKQFRTMLNIEASKPFPGVLWLRGLMLLTLIFFSVLALMSIWGASQERLTAVLIGLQDGFSIGEFQFDPLQLIYAIVLFVVLLSIIPLIKHHFIASFLKHSSMSRGAKEATETLIGYAGFALAIFVALSTAGVNFKNIAIIAGALSVGIGFGLQNIVNNFLSGLILLFERPIRRGDWIVVGTTEGYVKDISIRSTVIQTFQNADVIVPNSQLISDQVTNWMLNNNIGQIRMSFSVAYGTDTSKVIEILETVAAGHEAILPDHPRYPIQALFLEFGESSLNFELRFFLRNIDNRWRVQSDINLAIDRLFREHGIEIPFPQRVIHMAKDDGDTPEEK